MVSPLKVKIPKSEHESYEYIDAENTLRKVTPPGIHHRSYLKNDIGEAVYDPEGNFYYLGDGGISHFTTYTTDDGLALDNVTSSLLDKSGNLWFGTWGGGVSKFDGISFTNFTTAHGLSNNLIHCLAQDADGNIWIGTEGGGISKYDGYTFTTISKAQGISDDIVYNIIMDSKGFLWIATARGGVSKFDGENFIHYNSENGLPSKSILKIAEDKKGNIWFATSIAGASRFDGTAFTNYSQEDGLGSDQVLCITVDSHGDIWFGTVDGGISKYEESADANKKGTFTNYTVEDGLGDNQVWMITEDYKGNLWMATGGGGISKFDGKKFTNYTTTQGLANNVVYSIIEDESKNLWIGTAGGGVSLYHGTAFKNYTNEKGLAQNSVYSILEDNGGNFWFATEGGGVSMYDGKSFTNYSTDQGLANDLVISALKDNKGNLWFGTGGGGISLYQEDHDHKNASFTTFNSYNGLPNKIIFAITEDHEGNLWFGTGGGGLVKYDGNITSETEASFTSFTTVQGLAGDVVYSICEDRKGNIWIGTKGKGVSKYDGKSFTNYNTDHGLSNNIVWSILEDKRGNMWFATQGGGVSRFDGKEFSSFTAMEGLVDDNVYDLLEDSEGNIFIGTNRGFTVIPSNIVALPFVEMRSGLEHYNTSYGYPVKDVNKGIFLDSQGMIWAGNGSDKTALVRFDHRALVKKKKRPLAKISKISVNDKAISWNSLLSDDAIGDEVKDFQPKSYVVDEIKVFGKVLTEEDRQDLRSEMANVKFSGISRFDNYPEQLILPYSHNQITIEFATDELARPNLIEYKYILEGYSKDWSPILKRNSATFGNIREGDYMFKVMARYTGPSEGASKDWSEAGIYSFTVLPPWYRTWWAYLIYTLILLVGIRRVHVIQKTKTIRKERERIQKRELEQAREIEKAYKELKATQAQLIQSEKMASLGELTAGIAHEIQNPLNFVNNFSELNKELIIEIMEERRKDKDSIDEILVNEILEDIKENESKINYHGRRAESIVKGMLEHSKTGTGVKELTDINKLASEYLNLAYRSFITKNKGVTIELVTEFDTSLPPLELVRPDMGKVLLNILNNAFHASSTRVFNMSPSPVGGYNGLHSGPGSDHEMIAFEIPKYPQVSLRTKNLGVKIEITITDNGPGIPESIKDKIFQPFFTTKSAGQGTGLGLSLAYDIVKTHGGEISVKSALGEGSSFTITLSET